MLRPAYHAVPAGRIREALPCRSEAGCAAACTPILWRDWEQQEESTTKHSLEKKPHSSLFHTVASTGPEGLSSSYQVRTSLCSWLASKAFGVINRYREADLMKSNYELTLAWSICTSQGEAEQKPCFIS